VSENSRRVGVGGVGRLPVKDGRNRADGVGETVGEAGRVDQTAIELRKEEVEKDLRS
jgi:hypothetical protein